MNTAGVNDPIIRYVGVYKSFGPQHVCHDFNLEVNRGETLTIIGASGVGKTVSIKMLIGLLDADQGEIWFDGMDVARFTRDEDFLSVRKRVAMVFQGSALFDSMSVFDNVAYPLREQLQLSSKELKAKVEEKLSWVGLPNASAKMPAELSGGMKKRIGLARAIATDPEVILYDEPTAGLDPINTVRITDLILSLQEKMHCTSIVVTHDIPSAVRLSDRAAFLQGGRVLQCGKMDELMNSKNRFVRGFLAGDPKLADEV